MIKIDNETNDYFDVEKLQKRWIAASFQSNIDSHTIHIIQGIGELEMELEIEEKRLADVFHSNHKETIEYNKSATRLINLSRLWLLGAYELVRLMDQNFRRLELKNKYTDQLNKFKNIIAKYRIPLAKLERKGKPNQTLIARPFLFGSGEVGWQIDNEAYR